MKLLRNKSTGEIGCLVCSFGKTPERITVVQYTDGKRGSKVWYYDSLAELNEEWRDYEEPKGMWAIGQFGEIYEVSGLALNRIKELEDIGNIYNTEEEAEQAVEKLKARTRLKDKGFRFTNWRNGILLDETVAGQVRYEFPIDNKDSIEKDLDLLFGGEE